MRYNHCPASQHATAVQAGYIEALLLAQARSGQISNAIQIFPLQVQQIAGFSSELAGSKVTAHLPH